MMANGTFRGGPPVVPYFLGPLSLSRAWPAALPAFKFRLIFPRPNAEKILQMDFHAAATGTEAVNLKMEASVPVFPACQGRFP